MKNRIIILLKLVLTFISFIWLVEFLRSIFFVFFERYSWVLFMKRKRGTFVHPFSSIRNAHNVSLGYKSRINYNCTIWAGEIQKIIFGDNLLMGPNVSIHAVNHGTARNSLLNSQKRNGKGNVVIGNDCWIGANCTILPGSVIPDGCIIASNSVVNKKLDKPFAIYAGSPVKFIRYRQ
jgi:maltose O-acetyltransferase